MRPILLSLLIVLTAANASAQGYPQQPVAQPQQLSDNYSPAIAAYNQPQYAQPQYAQPAPQPQHIQQQPQPSDYGQSVTTDIRQMNF